MLWNKYGAEKKVVILIINYFPFSGQFFPIKKGQNINNGFFPN
jgi:hypothetical protein